MGLIFNCLQDLNDKDHIQDALRNSLILNQIFSFLPTRFLLHHSSLVNRLWCEESRKFIRDYRGCTVRISHESEAKPFVLILKKFSECLSQANMAVPYSGISVAMMEMKQKGSWSCFNPSHPGSCHSDDDYDKLCASISSSRYVKLQYLSLDLDSVDCFHCSKHWSSLAKVLRFMSGKIEHLNVIQGSSLLTVDVDLMSSSTVFPKLEILKIDLESLKSDTVLFNKIINSAPNLKQISHDKSQNSIELLRLLPQEKFHLV